MSTTDANGRTIEQGTRCDVCLTGTAVGWLGPDVHACAPCVADDDARQAEHIAGEAFGNLAARGIL
jgi:hypothetical protein